MLRLALKAMVGLSVLTRLSSSALFNRAARSCGWDVKSHQVYSTARQCHTTQTRLDLVVVFFLRKKSLVVGMPERSRQWRRQEHAVADPHRDRQRAGATEEAGAKGIEHRGEGNK